MESIDEEMGVAGPGCVERETVTDKVSQRRGSPCFETLHEAVLLVDYLTAERSAAARMVGSR
jgi:hypothetical protein